MIFQKLKEIKLPEKVKLVAVSKYQTNHSIKEAYLAGQRDFGENYIQELVEKQKVLPKNISWHMIGKLQSNKIKYIASFIEWIHSIENFKQLEILNKEAYKYNRKIKCLLQIKISEDVTKSGINAFKAKEILDFLNKNPLFNIEIKGFMGIASLDKNLVKKEFQYLSDLFKKFKNTYKHLDTLSMGMSLDYKLALKEGANLIRIGKGIFGEKNLKNQ